MFYDSLDSDDNDKTRLVDVDNDNESGTGDSDAEGSFHPDVKYVLFFHFFLLFCQKRVFLYLFFL